MNKRASADDELLITDPENQPGVVLDVPQGVKPVALSDQGYLADKMVRCSFCPQRQWHRKGYFGVLPDGSKALCGHCCAVILSSKQTVARIDRVVEKQKAAAKDRLISEALLEGVPELLEVVDRDFLPIERQVCRSQHLI